MRRRVCELLLVAWRTRGRPHPDKEIHEGTRLPRPAARDNGEKNPGCEELKQAILAGINWDEIPCRTTEVLFKRLKEEIIRLKDEGRVLMRFSELRETLQLRLEERILRGDLAYESSMPRLGERQRRSVNQPRVARSSGLPWVTVRKRVQP